MHQMDKDAEGILLRLSQHFGVPRKKIRKIASSVPLGIEIEVKWRYYFPDLWLRFFDSGRLSFADMSDSMQRLLTQACKEREQELIPKLSKTQELGVRKGNDRYWEFALPPSYSVDLSCAVVEMLHQGGVLPLGHHPLHITFGGLRRDRAMYYLLAILEILYTRKERLLAGAKNQAWAIKGRAGIFEKPAEDLAYGFSCGSEIKILEVPPDLELFQELMSNAATLASHVEQKQLGKNTPRFDEICTIIKETLVSLGLPDTRWMNPKHDADTWATFAGALPEIRKRTLGPIREFLNKG